MVNQEISNIYDFQCPEDGLLFLEEKIEEMFPNFILVEKYNNGDYNGFGITYECGNIKINLGCERNALTHLIEIDDNKFTLYKFDEKMKQVLAYSRKNILFTLTLISKVIGAKR